MSLDDNMTKIMNVVRHFTGDTDKLSFDEAVDSLLKLKSNGLKPTELKYGTDFNHFFNPGVYTAWLKLMKNTPLDGSDEGSIVFIMGNDYWALQILFSFYHGVYYRADTFDALIKGKAWKEISTKSLGGGVTEPLLYALHRYLSSSMIGGVA